METEWLTKKGGSQRMEPCIIKIIEEYRTVETLPRMNENTPTKIKKTRKGIIIKHKQIKGLLMRHKNITILQYDVQKKHRHFKQNNVKLLC